MLPACSAVGPAPDNDVRAAVPAGPSAASAIRTRTTSASPSVQASPSHKAKAEAKKKKKPAGPRVVYLRIAQKPKCEEGTAVGSTERHTYAIYTVGGGTVRSMTVKASAKILDKGLGTN